MEQLEKHRGLLFLEKSPKPARNEEGSGREGEAPAAGAGWVEICIHLPLEWGSSIPQRGLGEGRRGAGKGEERGEGSRCPLFVFQLFAGAAGIHPAGRALFFWEEMRRRCFNGKSKHIK